ncbi:copper resistance CopC family protein [Micromonospora ureilytica]|uniref:Methionine-rich copper-binding protein CopC n=1 Tax=Micromonospora ureilytica TaxID=709868 RepID=A0ABS0JGA1_9ACTN|nr:copper resistance protein CopC [Micromonospora ureilytica]MBG6065363.1 methionine-rich copper-binding protein CopC [Micromonospora ureilytica]
MRSKRVTVRKVLSRVVAALAATVVVTLLLPVAPASAHGQLATSTPLKGTVVREPLTQLALYFTEKPASNAHFTISGPNGSRVDNGWSYGEPKRLDKPVTEYFMVNGVFEPRLYHTGFPAMVTVAHWPAKGRYTASYLSVASDGEAVRGEVTFDYQGRGTAAPAGWSAPTAGPDPALLAQAEGEGSTNPAASGSPVGPTGAPASPPAGAAEEQRDTGFPAWLIPALIVVTVAVLVLVAARRRPAERGASPAGRRPAGAAGRGGAAARTSANPTRKTGNRTGGSGRRGRR